MYLKEIKKILLESLELKQSLLTEENLLATIDELVEELVAHLKAGKSLYLCGNGGSAADALHIAAEFSGRFYLNRPGLSVEALNVNEAALTAISNDFGFEYLFARLLESKAKKGDMLWVFTTSGKSPNILKVLEKAKEMDVRTVAFSGQNTEELHLARQIIAVPSKVTPRIQEAHMLIAHIICELVENKMFNV
ncbi:MAG: SIS domain-containing protein [Bacteroidetes bacterium]|nr:SIS domain-containing protein [Bacteroidota bacterium]